MSNAVYATLSRQQGLMREMQVVANNIANANTTGFKSDRAVFTEYIAATGPSTPSLSMGNLGAHAFRFEQGAIETTGAPLDLAIGAEGFFVIDTPDGERLTRAGHFQLNDANTIVNAAGNVLMDTVSNPIVVPDGVDIQVGRDGSVISGGAVIGQIAVVTANGELGRGSNTDFIAPGGFAAVDEPHVLQGSLEQSNVAPVLEIARMIEVQRAYEASQSILEREDQRISQLITATRER
ncbi:MAG: flagellar hook-basal body complex protein [Pseudomonadota bacterium]